MSNEAWRTLAKVLFFSNSKTAARSWFLKLWQHNTLVVSLLYRQFPFWKNFGNWIRPTPKQILFFFRDRWLWMMEWLRHAFIHFNLPSGNTASPLYGRKTKQLAGNLNELILSKNISEIIIIHALAIVMHHIINVDHISSALTLIPLTKIKKKPTEGKETRPSEKGKSAF